MKEKFLELRNHLGNMTDPISDMIVRMKNAGLAGKESVLVPFSSLKFEIASLLEKEGFIKSISKKTKKSAKFLEIELLPKGSRPRIQGVRRVSKPSRRIYQKYHEIKPVKRGLGINVFSTPKGILSGKTARKEKVGGEALFEIW